MRIDLRGRSLEEVTDFVFARAVPTDPDADSGWWWKVEIVFEPAEYIGNVTTILRNAADLRSRYTPDQLEQGFWFLISGAK